MSKKKVILTLSAVVISVFAILMIMRNIYLNKVEDIVMDVVKNRNIESEYISKDNAQKILEIIYLNDSDAEQREKIDYIECSLDKVNWIDNNVQVSIMCKSSDFKDWVCMEYFKISFKISKGKVHITKVGYYIDNAGDVTDLD